MDLYPTRLRRTALLQQWGNVPIMAGTSAVNVGSIMLWMPILALTLRDLGATDLQVSIGVAAWTAGGAVGQYVGGIWTDRFGRFPIAVYPLYAAALALAFAARMTSWMPFLAAYVIYSTVSGLQHPVFPAVIGESVSSKLRGRAFGTVHLCIATATIIGPLVGGQLVPRFGGQNVMLVTAAIWLITGAARHRFLKETRPGGTVLAPFAFVSILKSRLLKVTLISGAFQIVLNLTMWGPFLALHASDYLHLSRYQINTYYAIGACATAAVSPLAGRTVERFGAYRTLAVSCLLLGLSAIMWSLQSSVTGIIAGYILMGVSFQFAIISMDTFRVVALDEGIRARALGAAGTISMIASALMMPVAGYLKEVAGTLSPFIMALAFSCVLYVAIMGLHRSGDEIAVRHPH